MPEAPVRSKGKRSGSRGKGPGAARGGAERAPRAAVSGPAEILILEVMREAR